MNKKTFLTLTIVLVLSFSSFVCADNYQFIGREIWPGVDKGDIVVGALFVGKFFNGDFTAELGRFTIILDNDGENVESCNNKTKLLLFKLIMNFNSGARLVLNGPTDDDDKYANWSLDDPNCLDGNCILADYSYYLPLFNPAYPAGISPVACDDEENYPSDPDLSFIAKVDQFDVERQWLGSYRVQFKKGQIKGYLVHTPVLSPAIFGTLVQTE